MNKRFKLNIQYITIVLISLIIIPLFWSYEYDFDPILFTNAWLQNVIDLIKIFLTFLLVNYFWDNLKEDKKKQEEINYTDSQFNLFCNKVVELRSYWNIYLDSIKSNEEELKFGMIKSKIEIQLSLILELKTSFPKLQTSLVQTKKDLLYSFDTLNQYILYFIGNEKFVPHGSLDGADHSKIDYINEFFNNVKKFSSF